MLRRVDALPPGPEAPTVWLTRPGALTLQDVDVAWDAAARSASAELACGPLRLVVVTRAGWWEPATGSGRRWRRLRTRT